jgi:hypothetical protein
VNEIAFEAPPAESALADRWGLQDSSIDGRRRGGINKRAPVAPDPTREKKK